MSRSLLAALFLAAASAAAGGKFTRYVDPFIGTGGHGHTYPGASMPFGMVQLSPDTRTEGWDACGGYYYADSTILGFSHTHLSGTGVADYGDILFLPVDGAPDLRNAAARFSHAHERASPGYYSVLLEPSHITAELTATTRVGIHRYTFPHAAGLLIDLRHGLGTDTVLESSIEARGREVAGMRRSSGWAKDQRIYFVAQFSSSFKFSCFAADSLLPGTQKASGTNLKACLTFSRLPQEKLTVKVGISAVSIGEARKNISAEAPGWDFTRYKEAAASAWNRELGKIAVEGGSPAQMTTFYTALYHAMLTPNVFSDASGTYRGMDGNVHTAKGYTMYTVFSLWDTFRAEHPLLALIDRKRSADFVASILGKDAEAGHLPVWELAGNETWCMIGYHSVPVIVDAYMKGIGGVDPAKALAAMERTASLDRAGLGLYRAEGVVPGDKESESVSKTLEYAYDDWCIGLMAEELGKSADAERFFARSQYFRNLFDPSTRFMRPVVNGAWAAPFDPTAVTFHYTEANPWQYSFFAPQDIPGLIELCGGDEEFIARLDSLFNAAPKLTGRDQADISGLIGQYAQGNEPSHHVAYLYDYAGAAWKTQDIVRRIVDSLYTTGPAGLCGNDDCGQMSAWYVLSALGFYPVTPGDPSYCIGSPLFPKATIHLENGRSFVITADRVSRENRYIQMASLNGDSMMRSFIQHREIASGGSLRFMMGNAPRTVWGSYRGDRPHMQRVNRNAAIPHLIPSPKTFVDSMLISYDAPEPGGVIHFTTDGSTPDSASPAYTSPFVVRKTTAVKALTVVRGLPPSPVVEGTFEQSRPIGTLALRTRYSDQYPGGGDGALVDGIRGSSDFRLGAWQGYDGTDLDAVVAFDSLRTISEASLGCLADQDSWIFFPTSVEFSFSNDDSTWSGAVTKTIPQANAGDAASIVRVSTGPIAERARYLRVKAKNLGDCPPWHKGAGHKAWLFVDEISVK